MQAILLYLVTKAEQAELRGEVGWLRSEVGLLRGEVVELRTDLAAVKAILPHLATKADLADLRADQERLRGEIHAAMNALTWRLVGALLVGLTALAGLIVALQIFA